MAFRRTFILFIILVALLSAALLHLVIGLPELNTTTKPALKPRPKYPTGVPNKFDPDGNVQHFPGNTIISHLSNSTELYSSLLFLHDRLKESRFGHLYTLLPPSSWHMTIFEGVVDKIRKPGYWPSDLALDAPLENCTALFEKKLSSFDLHTELPYKLSIAGFQPLKNGIALDIKPLAADNKALRGLRDRLRDSLQLHFPHHDSYGFHVSVSYFLRYLTDEQNAELMDFLTENSKDMPKEFELGPPEFCTFEDMFAFKRLFYLKNQDN